MIGYQLFKTLSANGSVSRGVCKVDNSNHLLSITERTNIYAKENSIVYEDKGEIIEEDKNAKVSMNFWCFHPNVLSLSEVLFKDFLVQQGNNPKSEFFIPLPVDEMIKKGLMELKVMESNDKWYGVTYQEDKPIVQAAFKNLIEKGVYPNPLW